MPKSSAGLLMYRRRAAGIEVFLVHPGGPYWARKDLGAWTIPKGECDPGEDPAEAARREFREETGHEAGGPLVPLAPVRLKSGKVVAAWAVEGDLDPAKLTSNTVELEWPPRSGRRRQFPEVDRGAWFRLVEAARWIRPEQRAFLEELPRALAAGS